jgi:hypothetical protein
MLRAAGMGAHETGPPHAWGPLAALAAHAGYERRRPEQTPLYRAVAGSLETLVELARQAGEPLPARIVRVFEKYLDCGILAKGFLRVRCESCHKETLVAFSCKQRGLCPSCAARHAAESAAWLVDRVLPDDPIRQWTISLPFRLRLRLARDGHLRRRVLDECLGAVFEHLREACGERFGRTGSVTFVQNFGSALNLNVHFHVLVPDGVYVSHDDRPLWFREAPPLTDDDVVAVTRRMAGRVAALLERRGVRLPRSEPPGAVEQLQAASLLERTCLGERAGKRLRRAGGNGPPEPHEPSLCAVVDGFSVHAGTRIAGSNRLALERLCRYGLRGPLALSRLEARPHGTLAYHLRHPGPDGATVVLFEPLELLQKLVALIPEPGEHWIHFHGLFAAHARQRAEIVPLPTDAAADNTVVLHGRVRRRLDWASLLRRVFAVEVLVCALCGGRRRIVAAIEPGPVATQILDCLNLPTTAPPRARARAPPQASLDFAPAPPDDLDQRIPDVA